MGQRIVGLILLCLFGYWVLNEDLGSGLARVTTGAEAESRSQKIEESREQLTKFGNRVVKMDRQRVNESLDQRLLLWKEKLEHGEKKARVFKEGKDQFWILSASGELGVHLQRAGGGTIERVFRPQALTGEENQASDRWKPPWSTLEFSSSSVDSPRRQLRIYRSEGGAGAVREHYHDTLKEEGWTTLEHGEDVLIFQRGSSRAWVQITPDGPHSKIILLLTI